MIRVFLVDDHEVVRRGLTELLGDEPDLDVVGEAGSLREALTRIPATASDVAVVDARLPDGSGIEVCRAIGALDPPVRSLVLTSYDDDEAVYAAVMAGAAGYLLKEVGGSRLVESVRLVAGGQSLLDPAVTERVLRRLREPRAVDPRLARLSARERQILVLIATGMTNRQIGAELFVAEKTVKNYVSGLLAKLDMERRTQAAVFGAAMRVELEVLGRTT